MTDRGKIITIYTVVGILSVGVLATSFWIRGSRKSRFVSPIADKIGGAVVEDFGSLENDITLTNQDGEEVKLSELKDKVWVASNFFATCPYCLETASEDLKSLYQEFSPDSKFHVVSISIDPETDKLQQLEAYAQVMGAESRNWWFLRGEEKAVHEYLEKEIGYMKVVKNEVPPAKNRYSHDRGLLVFNGWKCVKKRDLQFARTQGERVKDYYFQDVRKSILKSLASRSSPPVESP